MSSLSVSAAPLEQIDPQLLQDLKEIRFDKKPEQLVRDIHYVASDEQHHHHFREHIENKGGVFIGIGTNQNYEMAGWARPELLVLLDFDQMVVDVHQVYRVFFLNADSPEALIDLWRPEKEKLAIELLEKAYSDRKRRAALRAYRFSRKRILRALERKLKIAAEDNVRNFLTDKDQYLFIVELFKTDRVIAIRGDLTKKRAMSGLASVLNKHQMTVQVYHPSNAEQYFAFTSQYRKNILALPTTETSVVARTRAWAIFTALDRAERRKLKRQLSAGKVLEPGAPEAESPPKKKVIYYTYATQSFDDFRGWISDRRVYNIRKLLPRSSRIKNGHYAIPPHKVRDN